MKWYYKSVGTHTYVRVFMNGAMCGELCFRNEEFYQFVEHTKNDTEFIEGYLSPEDRKQFIEFVPSQD